MMILVLAIKVHNTMICHSVIWYLILPSITTILITYHPATIKVSN